MDVASGAGRYGTKEIPGYDGVRIGAADTPGGFGSNPAGSVGTETTADALQAKTAFGGLAFHSVVGSLQGELADIFLHRLIRTGTGIATEAIGTSVHNDIPPP